MYLVSQKKVLASHLNCENRQVYALSHMASSSPVFRPIASYVGQTSPNRGAFFPVLCFVQPTLHHDSSWQLQGSLMVCNTIYTSKISKICADPDNI